MKAPKRKGRPPGRTVGGEPMTIRLDETTRRRIGVLVGQRQMTPFIRQAIEAELQRREAAVLEDL